jgi:hypothetical protein
MAKLLLRKCDEFSFWRLRFYPRIVYAIYLVKHSFVGAVRVSHVTYHSTTAEYSPNFRDWYYRSP